jgi:DNA-directed RNA polymerase subunit RPC12/RpoP
MIPLHDIMGIAIDGGAVEDCDVVRACREFCTTDRVGSEWMVAFIMALPERQRAIAGLMVDVYQCPTCGQGYQSAVAVNADGSAHCRCPHCGAEW